MSTLEIRDRMGQAWKASDELLKRAQSEGRDLTAEEQVTYDRQWADYTSLKAQAERIEAHERARQDLLQIVPNLPDQEQKILQGDKRATQEYRDAFMGYVRDGVAGEQLRTEMNTGISGAKGGYTVPTNMLNTIVELTREANIIRQIAQVIRTNNTTTIPTVTTNTTSYWKAEEAAYAQGEPVMGQASLGAYKATALLKISEELLQDTGVDIEGFLASNIGESLGALEETAFIAGAGSGSDCPLGLVGGACQASSSSVATSGYATVSSAELIDMFHALAPRYRRNATWLMKDSTIKLIRKLTEAVNGQFLWQPGLQAGQPDMLLGRPLYASDNMPAAAQAAKFVVFGDFSYCLVGDRAPVSIQRLTELYAANGQIGFKAFARVDMAVTNSAAIQYSTTKL